VELNHERLMKMFDEALRSRHLISWKHVANEFLLRQDLCIRDLRNALREGLEQAGRDKAEIERLRTLIEKQTALLKRAVRGIVTAPHEIGCNCELCEARALLTEEAARC
jgi:hypothetical protein